MFRTGLLIVCTCAIVGHPFGESRASAAPQPPRAPRKVSPKAAKPAPVPKPAPPQEAASPAKPDIKIAARYVTGDKDSTTVVWMTGTRQRIDYGSELSALQQCDLDRGLQLNHTAKTFLVTSSATPRSSAPQRSSESPAQTKATKGGVITYTITVVNTGDRKDVFGFPARHVKTVITKEASAEACSKGAEQVETDGWYIDLPRTLSCTTAAPKLVTERADPNRSDCRDQVRYEQSADATPGYPVEYVMVSKADQNTVTTTMNVLSLDRTDIPMEQFEVPNDYLEVKTLSQLTADHRPGEAAAKKPGTIRIGVASIVNKTDEAVSLETVSSTLVDALATSDVDVVRLKGATAAERDTEANAKQCDYVLQSTVTELKRPGQGMLGKMSGSSSEGLAAKVDFALTAPGKVKPEVAGAERSGTSTLRVALGAAKQAARFASPYLLKATPLGMMSAMGSMNGASSAAFAGTADPVTSNMLMLLDRAMAPSPEAEYTTQDAAVAAAIQKVAQSVGSQFLKKKSKS